MTAAGTSFDCIVCGTCVADVLVRPVPLTAAVGAGRLFHVEPIEAATGGIVCNSGTAMRRLGMNVAAASLVGDDHWADLVRRWLADEGIDTQALDIDPTLPTSTTAALIDPSGERSFAHHVGAPGRIDLAFVRRHLDRFARSRMALVGYVGLLPALEPQLADALATIRNAGPVLALETAGSGGTLASLAPALPFVDVYVPSLDEAAHQTGLADPREIIACYRRHGAAGIVGVKLGSRGAILSDASGATHEIPCIKAPGPVADTTGAGDSFIAGLLTGMLRGMPLPAAGLLGAATAACCVTGMGATAGLRDLAGTMELVARFADG
jgi:sugar/nucleoside kinase (ribokinase family)